MLALLLALHDRDARSRQLVADHFEAMEVLGRAAERQGRRWIYVTLAS